MVVEAGEMVLLRRGRVVDRRVVAEQDELDTLQSHHAIRLGPPAVVADAHAHDRTAIARHRPAEVADLEVALLEMLKRAPRLVLGVAGQMDLAIREDDTASRVDENRRVVAMTVPGLLGVAEAKAESEPARLVE